MQTLTEQQVRTSLVDATRREAAQMTPPDLTALPWERLDVLGWSDRRSPSTAYVVARRAGSAGRDGDTARTLVCADSACSTNARRPPTASEAGPTADDAERERRVTTLRERAARFVAEVVVVP